MKSNIERMEAEIERLKRPVTASELVRILEAKHAKDVFVAECKDGPTHTASHRRLDAWVLLKTWSPITTIGYEIKVTRSDWLADKKIIDYLPLCHYLSIVAPKGIVLPEELPAGIGLLEPAGTGDGRRLVTRKKAVWRDIALPGELLVYVLMCRTKITRDTMDEGKNWRVHHLRSWLEETHTRRDLGYAVNKKIRSYFDEQEQRLVRLQHENQQLTQIKQRLVDLGFDPAKPIDVWSATDRMKTIAGAIDQDVIANIEQTERSLSTLREYLKKVKERHDI